MLTRGKQEIPKLKLVLDSKINNQ